MCAPRSAHPPFCDCAPKRFKEQRVDLRPFTILSLCAGVGGLDLGLRVAQPNARTVCFVEIEAYAAAILATRMEQDALDQAPVWTDLRTFDGTPWRGLVDCITAGYPCQPFSVAGKQLGDKDPRHLWPDVFRVVREIDPPLCFFENVPGHLRLGFQQVHDDLRSLGYRVKAGLFSAEEVGASHKRERLFILAYRESVFGQQPVPERDCEGRPPQTAGSFSHHLGNAKHDGSSATAFTGGDGTDAGTGRTTRRPHTPQQSAGTDFLANAACAENVIGESRNVATAPAGRTGFNAASGDGGGNVAHATGAGKCRKAGNLPQAQRGQDGSVLWLPVGSSDGCANISCPEDIGEQLSGMGDTECKRLQRSGELQESMHPTEVAIGETDWPDDASQSARIYPTTNLWPPRPLDYERWEEVPEDLKPTICRMADGMANRVDRLRAGGNGVVPLAAAYAWRTLVTRAATTTLGETN